MPRTWVGVKAMCGNRECPNYLLELTIDLYTDTFELPECGSCGEPLRDPDEVREEEKERREMEKARAEAIHLQYTPHPLDEKEWNEKEKKEAKV